MDADAGRTYKGELHSPRQTSGPTVRADVWVDGMLSTYGVGRRTRSPCRPREGHWESRSEPSARARLFDFASRAERRQAPPSPASQLRSSRIGPFPEPYHSLCQPAMNGKAASTSRHSVKKARKSSLDSGLSLADDLERKLTELAEIIVEFYREWKQR